MRDAAPCVVGLY